MTNICSKLCVDNSIFSEAYINKCLNGMVFIQNICKNYMQKLYANKLQKPIYFLFFFFELFSYYILLTPD